MSESNKQKNIYTRFGKQYIKLSRNDIIPEGAMHAYCGGELNPIINPSTIGDKPSSFSDEREFYAPIKKNSI